MLILRDILGRLWLDICKEPDTFGLFVKNIHNEIINPKKFCFHHKKQYNEIVYTF